MDTGVALGDALGVGVGGAPGTDLGVGVRTIFVIASIACERDFSNAASRAL